jgi:SSS family solute:Na+ symporter
VFVALLALAGFGIAARPPGTFLDIATEAFTGLAVLFPTVIATLYWKRATAKGAIASILVGEGLVAAYHFQLVPKFGTLPVVPVVAAASLVLVLVSLLTRASQPEAKPSVPPDFAQAEAEHPHSSAPPNVRARIKKWGWPLVLVLLFVSGNDFWAWNDGRPGPLGFPWWVWYCLGLCGLLAVAFWGFSRSRSAPGPIEPQYRERF